MKAFYLKINRNQPYTIRNLKYWFDIVFQFSKYKIYLLCDNKLLQEVVMNEIQIDWDCVEIIESERNNAQLTYIIKNVANEHWINAGLAHLTTFSHAQKNGIDAFWNIDADDTVFCVPKERVAEIIRALEEYAKNVGNFGVMGLDMWFTFTKALHWSFGITYTNMDVDWIKIMSEHATDFQFKQNFAHRIQPQNIDGYFSYLKDYILEKDYFRTFYVENLRFIHYADDFIKRPLSSGMFKWKEGYLTLPILANCFEDDICGHIPIPEETVKLDIGLCDNDFRDFIDFYSIENIREKREWLR